MANPAHFVPAVAGSICSALSMMAHRKVSAESFDNLLLLVDKTLCAWHAILVLALFALS
jgi:hypothetical protein